MSYSLTPNNHTKLAKMPSKQQRYNDVNVDDRDDRSSTEVESLMEEKQWPGLSTTGRQTRTQRTCAIFNQWRWLIDTTLLVAILFFVIRLQQSPAGAAPSKYQLNGDITGVGPKCKQAIGHPLPLPC